MSTVVIFYPDKSIPPQRGNATLSFDSVELRAGVNSLSSDQLQLLQQHPDFARFQNLKAIELVVHADTVEPLANSEITDLGVYDIDQAATVVNNTNDLTILNSWLKTETRKPIRAIIATRINQLKSGMI